MEKKIESLKILFLHWAGEEADAVKTLPASGSSRRYFRLSGPSKTAIGAFHPVQEENRAFLGFTRHFLKYGLNVPEIYGVNDSEDIYLLEDLGDTTLFDLVTTNKLPGFKEVFFDLYRRALDELIRFQVTAGSDLDFSICYPRPAFDRQSMMWDLNYFKYYFLKTNIEFNEQKLQDDFDSLVGFLLQAPGNFFMYRDFQSRNIMIRDDIFYFIDYQGGRRGALQYDVASLLFQVKANLPPDLRERLLGHYLDNIGRQTGMSSSEFLKYYDGFIIIRLLQALGAYGYRGLIEKKAHFIDSIPFAMKNIQWWLDNNKMPVNLPELYRSLNLLAAK